MSQCRQLGRRQSICSHISPFRLYADDLFSVVMLRKNYRSHSGILSFSNDQFYGSQLIPSASPNIVDRLLHLEILPSAGFLVIFHGIGGQEEQEAGSPSFFNIAEASQVQRYVDKLLNESSVRIRELMLGLHPKLLTHLYIRE